MALQIDRDSLIHKSNSFLVLYDVYSEMTDSTFSHNYDRLWPAHCQVIVSTYLHNLVATKTGNWSAEHLSSHTDASSCSRFAVFLLVSGFGKYLLKICTIFGKYTSTSCMASPSCKMTEEHQQRKHWDVCDKESAFHRPTDLPATSLQEYRSWCGCLQSSNRLTCPSISRLHNWRPCHSVQFFAVRRYGRCTGGVTAVSCCIILSSSKLPEKIAGLQQPQSAWSHTGFISIIILFTRLFWRQIQNFWNCVNTGLPLPCSMRFIQSIDKMSHVFWHVWLLFLDHTLPLGL